MSGHQLLPNEKQHLLFRHPLPSRTQVAQEQPAKLHPNSAASTAQETFKLGRLEKFVGALSERDQSDGIKWCQAIKQEKCLMGESTDMILGLHTIAAALRNSFRCRNSKITHKQMEDPILVLTLCALAPIPELRNAEARSGVSSYTAEVMGGAGEVACFRPKMYFSETST